MVSNYNKSLQKKLENLINAKDAMPLDTFISEMKKLKQEIDISLIEVNDEQYAKESLLDQAKSIIKTTFKKSSL